MDEQQQELVAQFSGVTGASPASAQTALAAANWNLEEAVSLYFAAQEGDAGSDGMDEDEPSLPAQPTPAQPSAPQPAASSSSKPKPSGKKKQMTIDDLKKREEAGDDSSDDEDKKQNMFAGGEKSGLAVQNPNQGGGSVDHFKNIMNQARQNRERPKKDDEDDDAQPSGSSNFKGRAQTLGGDEAPSEVIEDPNAPPPNSQQALPRVTRTMHLWADGVSIDDGPLFRFDDPANQAMMEEINRGRAPLALLNVAPGQDVDLNLDPHKDENYVAPKKKWKPFSGSGQRLGSPTPGPSGSTSSATTMAMPAQQAESSSNRVGDSVQVDESQPTLQLQIRLGDGTRLSSRFNITHTIGDVYTFVNAASPASTQRAYALMTTFPTKELSDRSAVLGDGELKKGGVVVQKWT